VTLGGGALGRVNRRHSHTSSAEEGHLDDGNKDKRNSSQSVLEASNSSREARRMDGTRAM